MATEKRLTYVEDVIALFEKDIAESRDALKTAYHGDKDKIRAEMNGVRAALHILKHHASHGGTVDAVEVVHGRWIGGYKKAGNTFYYEKPHCSICGVKHEGVANYCPQCGAKMDGDGNG